MCKEYPGATWGSGASGSNQDPGSRLMQHSDQILIFPKGSPPRRKRAGAVARQTSLAVDRPEISQAAGHPEIVGVIHDLVDINEKQRSPKHRKRGIDKDSAVGNGLDEFARFGALDVEAMAVFRVRAKEIGHGLDVFKTVDSVLKSPLEPDSWLQVSRDDKPLLMAFFRSPVRATEGKQFA